MHRNHGTTTPRKLCLLATYVSSIALVAARPFESPFLDDCQNAMTHMISAMHIASHGDADADFAAMMIPHHEGAIAMATAELRYGRNEQLRRLAQEMIVTQQDEIVAMRLAMGHGLVLDSSTSVPSGAPK